MSCTNHPDTAANNSCAGCGKPFCRDCLVELGGKLFCASCKEEELRNIRSGVPAMAENLASPWARLVAVIIDGVVLSPVTVILAYHYWGQKLGMNDHYATRRLLPASVSFIYHWLMLRSGGQTLGKKAMDLKVVQASGEEITGQQAWMRPLVALLLWLTYVLGVVDALMIFSDRHLTLHDRIAKTKVVDLKLRR